MMIDPFTTSADADGREPLEEGGTWLLDLVAAVDHLRRGYRPNFTVWDGLAEAVHWSPDPTADEPLSSGADPLADGLRRLTDGAMPTAAAALQIAVRRWVTTMADRYNAGHHWPHPVSRRGFPPPTIDVDGSP